MNTVLVRMLIFNKIRLSKKIRIFVKKFKIQSELQNRNLISSIHQITRQIYRRNSCVDRSSRFRKIFHTDSENSVSEKTCLKFWKPTTFN